MRSSLPGAHDALVPSTVWPCKRPMLWVIIMALWLGSTGASLTNDGVKYPLRQKVARIPNTNYNVRRTTARKFANTNEDNGEPPIYQVRIRPFTLVMKPSPHPLKNQQKFQTIMQHTIEENIRQHAPEIDYVLLADAEEITWVLSDDDRRHLTESQTTSQTSLTFPGGVASFASVETAKHASVDVNNWVEKALVRHLIPTLEDTQYSHFKEAIYLHIKVDPSGNSDPTHDPKPDSAIISDSHTNNDTEASKLIFAALGACLLVVGTVLLFRKVSSTASGDGDTEENEVPVTKTPPSEVETDLDDNETDIGTEESYSEASVAAQYKVEDASLSVVSDFTMGSMDSSMVGEADVRKMLAKTELRMCTETFQRERHATIQKEMLHSMWSTDITNHEKNVLKSTLAESSSSRVDASSRSARKGNKKKRLEDTSINNNVFVFEEAHGEGEEVYLMPPSKVSKSRKPEHFMP